MDFSGWHKLGHHSARHGIPEACALREIVPGRRCNGSRGSQRIARSRFGQCPRPRPLTLDTMPFTLSKGMLRRDLIAASLLITARSGASGPTSNWPSFRGREASGVSDKFSLPAVWKTRWKSPIPGLGHSSPVIWENRLYVATAVRSSGKAPLKLGLYGDRDAADDDGEKSWKIRYCSAWGSSVSREEGRHKR